MKAKPKATQSLDTSVLKNIWLFARLDAAQLVPVIAQLKRRELAAGTAVFREGDPGEELFVVVSGRVTISITPAGGEPVLLSEVEAGGFFGEKALIDQSPRSADCQASLDSVLLSLHAKDLDSLLADYPRSAVHILDAMLEITTGRLLKTGAFLSEMVRWGETARARAVTDTATGLFNRRYMEDNLEDLVNHAHVEGKALSLVMFDMDHFGTLNTQYGMATGDRIIQEAAAAFRRVFAPTDSLIRYGGDEFVFLLTDTGPAGAQQRCDALCAEFRRIRLAEFPELRLTCSMGYASCPDHAITAEGLRIAADQGLYKAKEQGRDRALAADWPIMPTIVADAHPGKHEMKSIAEKNRVIRNIVAAIEERDDFLLIGHQTPDEDCLGAMVAFGLIAAKFGKRSTIATGTPISKNFAYLINICKYNSIQIIEHYLESGLGYSTVVIMDTPKPTMLDKDPVVTALLVDPKVLKIEIDHHLEADARYSGDEGYRLVSDASSSCELVAVLAVKIQANGELLARYQIQDLFARNLVLAILTGLIGDSHMGKYLKTQRERWFYKVFSARFENLLSQKTFAGKGNYNSKEDIFSALSSLSSDEEACFNQFMENERVSSHIRYVVLSKPDSEELFQRYGQDTAISVARSAADALAERSGYLSLVAYHDGVAPEALVQFRMRRSQAFTSLDLRTVLAQLQVENGGGHPGAVGFRFSQAEVPDIGQKADQIVAAVEAILGQVLPAEG